ncbi:zinc finger protein-like [Tropilaelaps mercedesae]|uniref:Zinc finger protein-like n=1 Tax=Tropilaelaps mercedesae TaxID=418985 RepID=A0A1V9X7E7_9ACAR|nr:zinc finger protein-like [Tropilaelaps mercedesae]
MSSLMVAGSAVGEPQEVAAGEDQDVDQEVVSEMVAFNAEEVAEVEGFEEWAEQQQQQPREESQEEGETTETVVSHDPDDDDGRQQQGHQHHIIEGAVMLSSGGQVVLVDAEAVDGRIYTRSVSCTNNRPAVHSFCSTLCNTVFTSKASLVVHQRREHPNATVTSSAQSTLSPFTGAAPVATPASDAVAASSEATRRSHICSLCNKGFTTSSNLHQHRRLHFNERPFQCNQCNKGFATSTNLKQHYRTHTGTSMGAKTARKKALY